MANRVDIHDCNEISISYDTDAHIFDFWLHNKALMLLLDDNEMRHLLVVLSNNSKKLVDVMDIPSNDDKDDLAKV
jgi:hypothetical protein